MGIFKKKKEFLDLSEHYRKQQEKFINLKSDMGDSNSSVDSQNSYGSSRQETNSGFGIFGGVFGRGNDSGSSSSEITQVFGDTVNPDERRRKIAKRLQVITEKLEDLSNQIYHLQNRLEVVERKLDVNRF